MIAHGNVVRVVVEMHVCDRHAVLILDVVVQRHPIGFLRHILTNQPHPGHVLVKVHGGRKLPPPCAWIEEGRHERHADREGFHLVAADEAA